MFRVLLIDDEPYVRLGLRSIIDWNSYGFTICGEGVDGNDGLKKILEQDPSLVLVDICMPGIQGIQLIKQAKSRGYKGHFIILTGYSDFEAAKIAVSLGVQSFLLKPIDKNELIESVIKVRDMLLSESETKYYIDRNKEMMKEKILNDIFFSGGAFVIDKKAMKFCGLDLDFDAFQVMIIKNYAPGENYRRQIRDFFKNESCADTVVNYDNVAVLLKGDCIKRFRHITDTIQKTALHDCNQIFIGAGRTVSRAIDIPVSFSDAKRISGCRFLYKQDNDCVLWNDIKHRACASQIKNTSHLFDCSAYILNYIETGNGRLLASTLDSVEAACRETGMQQEKTVAFLINIYLKLKTSLMSDYPEICDEFPGDSEIINQIYSKATLHDIIGYLKTDFLKIQSKLRDGISPNVVQRVITYIKKNYYKNLKLEKLAVLFGYNSAYLGKIFKSCVGDSFNTYLDNIRMENAKSLLLDSKLKVFEIAAKTGYSNVDYFHRKFKNHVGMSPKEYVKKYRRPRNPLCRFG